MTTLRPWGESVRNEPEGVLQTLDSKVILVKKLELTLKRVIFALVACLLLCAVAPASITPAQEEYYVVERDELMQAASNLDLPSGATKPEEPFLYFHIGATRLDFFALSIAKGDPKEFAAIADEAIRKGLGRELTIKYSRERGQIVLDSDEDRSKFLLRHMTASLDLEAIQSVFHAHGLKPKILLRTMNYYELSGFMAEGKSRSRKLYFDGTNLGRVNVSESITPLMVVGLLFFVTWPAICVLVGIKRGLKQGHDNSVPIEVRRKRYEKIVWGSVFVGIGLHLPLFIWFYGTGKLAIFSDLWTGSNSFQSGAGLLMMASIGAMSFLVKRMDKEEADLMGYDLKVEAAKREYRKKTTRLGGRVATVLMIVGLISFYIIFTTYREPRMAILALLFPVLIGILLMPMLERREANKMPFIPPDQEPES